MPEENKESTGGVRQIAPPVDVYETSDAVILLADVPGLAKENLRLDVEDDEVTIRGAFEEKDSGGEKLIDECIYGEYRRTFILADTIDREKITAKLNDGVLTVTLPKREKVKPRKIEIETEE
jgi:HSP20 family protein